MRLIKTLIQIFTESYERFLNFVKRSNAVSPSVALETATVLQVIHEEMLYMGQDGLV